MKRPTEALAFAFVVAASGCGPETTGYSADDIGSGAPSGSVDGASWAMIEATAEPDAFDDTELNIHLYGEDLDECGFPAAEAPYVMFSVPRQVGQYPLSFSLTGGGRTATIVVPPADNRIATEGIIVIETLSETEVSVGLIADAGDDMVNGSFTAPFCL